MGQKDHKVKMRTVIQLVSAFFIMLAVATWQSIVPVRAAYTFSGLHVQGNKLVNEQGQIFIPHGVNRSGSEYSCFHNQGFFDGPSDDASIQAMKDWGINSVKVPLNASCWLSINGAPAAFSGAAYQTAITNYVSALENHQIYPIVVFMWDTEGQPEMPLASDAVTLWQQIATRFKDDNRVILHLQEEPHPGGGNTSATWKCWRDGGSSCDGMVSAPAVGFQTLVNTVRAAGAKNVIALPGLQYANIMDQFLTYLPSDPLNNLMALVDVYPDLNTCGNTACYDAQYKPVIDRMPLAAGEFGESVYDTICGVEQSNVLMNWLDQHNSGYLAWVWNTWGTSCGNLSLITDFSGTPHEPNGTNYKNHIAQFTTGPMVTVPAGTLTPPIPSNTQPPQSNCPFKSNGDADCSGTVSLVDYQIWRTEYTRVATTSKADFNNDGGVSLADYGIWRRYFISHSGTTPSPNPTAHFSTLPPGSVLPSDSQCAAQVRRSSWEPRPDNTTANHTIPIAGQDYNIMDWVQFGQNAQANTLRARINGNFTGTTDEILQWVACKWGVDEDLVRAQAQQESYWHQSQLGDNTSDAAACAKIGETAPCYQSYGILQVKSTIHTVTWPAAKISTAFDADYAYGYWRSCYEGWIDWLKGGHADYVPGDQWGCVGHWFSGDWHTPDALSYTSEVQQKYQNKIWTQGGF
ncbi:cellulase family glycosylhydrolase [Candidatus Microgenomates bacterium]|nr:cellulase family glycosylhydrolase [Candidatus Microgenomates bacterium]